MKTELLHSYSSTSLSGLSRSPSQVTLAINGSYSTSETGLVETNKADNSSGAVGCLKEWSKNTFRRKILFRKLPILNWAPKYSPKSIVADFIAGLTVGLTILPQGLAYATIAGLPPQYGLYSGFVGCFVYIFFGSTKPVNIGPTASMAIITLSYGIGKPPQYTVILTFLTGLVTLAMGILQLGFVVNFISTPVMSGFTSAVAITIISTQIKALLGLKFKANGIIDVVRGTISDIEHTKPHDAILSVICIASLLFLQNLQKIFKCAKTCSPVMDKILWLISTSRSAIVVVVCTGIYAIWGGDPPQVAVVGNIVPGLPAFALPEFSFSGYNDTETGEVIHYTLSKIVSESSSALLVIPLLAIMEHITVAKATAGMARVDATQEMVTIGLSNLIGAFCNSMPITGSFSRTVVNHASGVASPLGGLVTGVLVILALQFLTPYFYYIPNASLAAVIVCAVIFTVDFSILRPMWNSKRMDLIPWGVTFLVSLLVGLEYGIMAGFFISLLFLLYYAARPGVRVKRGETSTGIEFILVELDRSLAFPSVEYTSYVVMKTGNNWAKGRLPVVVDCHHIQFADFTAAQGMKDLFTMFNDKKQELILWKLKPSLVRIVTGVMECSGTPFKHCSTENQLEAILEAKRADLEKDNSDIKITFTMAGEDDDSTGGSICESDEQSPRSQYKL